MIASLPKEVVMGLTVYGEARGQPLEGQRAVAWVIRNRADHPCWWGSNIIDVCLKKSQFSCWNADDPNYHILINKETRTLPFIRALIKLCGSVLLDDPVNDPTLGCNHYCTNSVIKKTKKKKNQKPAVIIGDHAFFKL